MARVSAALVAAVRAVHRRYVFAVVKRHRRRLSSTTFVGVTGSTGKTMTKELVARVLASSGPCNATPKGGNLRGYLTRTILQTTAAHRYCVLEVATYRPGFMAPHVAMIRPDIAIVTNVGQDHWRAFGSAEAIAREKATLVAGLPANGLAILNADDPLVMAMAATHGRRALTFGASEHADVRVTAATCAWPAPLSMTVQHGSTVVDLRTRLFGLHWQGAVLAALAAGVAVGVDLAAAARAIEQVEPSPGRMSVETHPDGVTFVRDDVKMSPASVNAALDFLRTASAPRKVAVLGTLADVPSGASKRAYDRVALAALAAADFVLFVGVNASMALRVRTPEHGDRLRAVSTTRELHRQLQQLLQPGDLVLVKGSVAADHLMRIPMARVAPMSCWRDRCGRTTHCADCELVNVPSVSEPLQEPVPSELGSPTPSCEPVPVVVGLGNPGERYAGTPHNLGHDVLDALARRLGSEWSTHPDAHVATALHQGHAFLLVKLLTPMNRTGDALRRWLGATGHSFSDCLLVYDDMDLPRGTVRVRRRGSAGGHRGVASVLTEFQTAEVPRVKVGVAGPDGRKLTFDQLLAAFPPEDVNAMADAFRVAGDKILEDVRRFYSEGRQTDGLTRLDVDTA